MQAFRHHLLGLIGQWVQLGRCGPDAAQGWLLSVQTDYLTLRCPAGSEMHRPLHHIRTVMALPAAESSPHVPAPAHPTTFLALLQAYCGQHGEINHGPEAWIGTLRRCTEDHIVLELAPGEESCIALFHVRSFTPLGALADAPRTGSDQEAGDLRGDVAPGTGRLFDHGSAGPVASGGNT